MSTLDKLHYALNLNKTKRQQIITKALKSNDRKVIKKELTSKFKNTNSSRVKADIDFVNSYKKIVKGGEIVNYKKNLNNAETVFDISEILIDAIKAGDKININFTDKNGCTALMYNSLNIITDNVKLLLENGADPNKQDRGMRTALIYACIPEKNKDVVELLLKNGANPDIQDISGRTALMHAVSRGHKSYVELLLEYDANPYIMAGGMYPIDSAEFKKYTKIYNLLKDYTAIYNAKHRTNNNNSNKMRDELYNKI
jgi:ankyrin repeat protein